MKTIDYQTASVAVFLIVILLIITFYRTKKTAVKKRFTYTGHTPLAPSGVNGSECLIIGDHPFANCSGTVIGYVECLDKWALVVEVNEHQNLQCYIFENKHLLWLEENKIHIEQTAQKIMDSITSQTKNMTSVQLFELFNMLSFRCRTKLEQLEDAVPL